MYSFYGDQGSVVEISPETNDRITIKLTIYNVIKTFDEITRL